MVCWETILVLTALIATTCADCGPDGLKCCLTEFLPLIGPSGLKLSEQKLAASCTIRKESLTCMEDFSDQCIAQGNDQLQGSINKTMDFINRVCPPTSDFAISVKKYEDCFHNASSTFESCYNKTALPEVPTTDDKSKWKAECCEYKELRNCAVQTIENACGQSASELILETVMSINGAGLEVACEEVFETCASASVTLASSLFTLVSIYSVSTVLRFL